MASSWKSAWGPRQINLGQDLEIILVLDFSCRLPLASDTVKVLLKEQKNQTIHF
jgi:hypothetical protein